MCVDIEVLEEVLADNCLAIVSRYLEDFQQDVKDVDCFVSLVHILPFQYEDLNHSVEGVTLEKLHLYLFLGKALH